MWSIGEGRCGATKRGPVPGLNIPRRESRFGRQAEIPSESNDREPEGTTGKAEVPPHGAVVSRPPWGVSMARGMSRANRGKEGW